MKELSILLVCIIIMFMAINHLHKNKEIILQKSSKSDQSYYVRKLPDSQKAADILYELCTKLEALCGSLKSSDKSACKRLLERFDCKTMSETIPGSQYTSYSVNKGEKLSICIRNKSTNAFLDINTITFVAIHELSHVMSESVGHTKEFWSNMKFLLEQAEKISIYKPVDYSKHPVKYCGMIINSSPYDFK
jgi:hypothetical protein